MDGRLHLKILWISDHIYEYMYDWWRNSIHQDYLPGELSHFHYFFGTLSKKIFQLLRMKISSERISHSIYVYWSLLLLKIDNFQHSNLWPTPGLQFLQVCRMVKSKIYLQHNGTKAIISFCLKCSLHILNCLTPCSQPTYLSVPTSRCRDGLILLNKECSFQYLTLKAPRS